MVEADPRTTWALGEEILAKEILGEEIDRGRGDDRGEEEDPRGGSHRQARRIAILLYFQVRGRKDILACFHLVGNLPQRLTLLNGGSTTDGTRFLVKLFFF